MSSVIFFLAALGAITGAVGVVMLRNPFYSVLALVGHLVSLAVLFLLLRAEFVAAVQVVVYAYQTGLVRPGESDAGNWPPRTGGS